MYSLTVVGFSLWIGYGVLLKHWPIIIPNSICLVLAAFILTKKLLPRREREKVADVLDPEVKS